MDFIKVFDMVIHNILTVKLDKMGFSRTLLSLIESFLIDRSQSVYDNGHECHRF